MPHNDDKYCRQRRGLHASLEAQDLKRFFTLKKMAKKKKVARKTKKAKKSKKSRK